jgi:hypothetical protein
MNTDGMRHQQQKSWTDATAEREAFILSQNYIKQALPNPATEHQKATKNAMIHVLDTFSHFENST